MASLDVPENKVEFDVVEDQIIIYKRFIQPQQPSKRNGTHSIFKQYI